MADLFTAYDFLLSPGINRLIQLGVKSTKSITIYKRLKKLLWIKINAWFTWHERKKNLFWKKKNFHAVFLRYLFVGICLPQCSFFFLAYFSTVLWKGVSYFFCHEMLHLRYCKGLKSSPVCTNMDCIYPVCTNMGCIYR